MLYRGLEYLKYLTKVFIKGLSTKTHEGKPIDSKIRKGRRAEPFLTILGHCIRRERLTPNVMARNDARTDKDRIDMMCQKSITHHGHTKIDKGRAAAK